MMSQHFKEFLQDEAGTVKIEMVIALPLLFFWLIGSFALFDAFWTYSQAEKASYVIADIASRTPTSVKETELEEWHAVFTAMTPRSDGGRIVRFTSISFLEGDYVVDWSRVIGNTGGANDKSEHTNASIPTDIIPTLAEFDSVLLVETFAPYVPIANIYGLNAFSMVNRTTIRPRFSRQVLLEVPDDPAGST